MEHMDYAAFRRKLKVVFADCKPWNVTFDWNEETDGEARPDGMPDEELDTMEMELETGPIYDLRIISVQGFYDLYLRKGWEAVIKEMQTRPAPVRRRRGEDYRLLLNEDGKALYDELRELRAQIARERHIPPYIIFMNRTLYEMVKMLPVNEEQLNELYGVGEINGASFGKLFLDKILNYTGGVWREMLIVK